MGKWVEIPEEWNRVTASIIGCAMTVGRELGPGLAEVLYERAMEIELRDQGISSVRQHECIVSYKGQRIGKQGLDLVVDDLVVVELKSTESVNDRHFAQLVGDMRVADLPLGLLINFGAFPLRDGVYRRMNPHSTRYSRSAVPSSSPSSSPSVSSVPSVPLRTPGS